MNTNMLRVRWDKTFMELNFKFYTRLDDSTLGS